MSRDWTGRVQGVEQVEFGVEQVEFKGLDSQRFGHVESKGWRGRVNGLDR